MAFGIETKFFRNTSFVSRYQIEQGINGTDSFAVIGLGQKFQASKTLSLNAAFEKGFHFAGQNDGFVSGSLSAAWMPTEDFKTSVRYEVRDRLGFGQILSGRSCRADYSKPDRTRSLPIVKDEFQRH